MNDFEIESAPLPQPGVLDEPFWDAAREERLVVQRCSRCGGYEWTPQFACSACLSDTLVWTEVSGKGEIYSVTIVRTAQVAGLIPPYVLAIVTLDEGANMLTNIIGTTPEDVRNGQRVEVSFVASEGGINLPCFRLAAPGEG